MTARAIRGEEMRNGLAYIRRTRGLTQAELAAQIGVRQDHVSKKEGGARRVTARDLDTFAPPLGFGDGAALLAELHRLALLRPEGWYQAEPESSKIDMHEYAPLIIDWCRANTVDTRRALAAGFVAFVSVSQSERVSLAVALDEWTRTGIRPKAPWFLPPRAKRGEALRTAAQLLLDAIRGDGLPDVTAATRQSAAWRMMRGENVERSDAILEAIELALSAIADGEPADDPDAGND